MIALKELERKGEWGEGGGAGGGEEEGEAVYGAFTLSASEQTQHSIRATRH